MMRKILLTISITISAIVFSQEQTFVPDDVLEQKIIDMGYDKDLDNYVRTSSLASIKRLNISGVNDATGIESCIAMEELKLDFGEITAINLSNNIKLTDLSLGNQKISTLIGLQNLTELEELNLASNLLTTIDVSNNINLEVLYIAKNNLTEIDVANNINLDELNVVENNITELNLCNNINLTRLFADRTNITSLDVSCIGSLTILSCGKNNLSSLNIANGNNVNMSISINSNPNLYCVQVDDQDNSFDKWSDLIKKDAHTGFSTNCSETTAIPDANFEQALIDLGHIPGPLDGQIFTGNVSAVKSLFVSNKNISDLTGIDVFNNLETLYIKDNNITSINLSSNLKLQNLSSSMNNLIDLDLSSNSELQYLTCDNNGLTNLDLSNNPKLINVTANNNSLSSFTLTNHTILEELDISENNLTSLNLTNNAALTDLNFENNSLTNLDLSSNYELVNIIANKNNLSSFSMTDHLKVSKLDVSENNLTLLDLSNSIKLEVLYAENNLLSSVDLTSNSEINVIWLNNNNITDLDLRNGSNETIYELRLNENPNLTCVQVDDTEYFSNQGFDTNNDQFVFSLDCSSTSQDIISISDTNFEQALIDKNIDSDGIVNGQVLASDIDTIEYLDINSKNISDLTGIEGFSVLETLIAHSNNLTSINVSKNLRLSGLVLDFNQLTSLDVSKNIELVSLTFSSNSITTIDLSKNTKLNQFYANNNSLATLDVAQLPELEQLYIGNNTISKLDVTQNAALKFLNCSLNQLTSLNLISNSALEIINCSQNNLEYLDLSQNPNLYNVIVNDNALQGLNIKNGANSSITNANFSAFANDSLTCIEVDDVNYSNTNWAQIDMQTSYNLSCIPVNDDCSYAVPIILGQDTPGNTTSASGSVNNPNCLPSGIVALDIWYSFPAPASGAITMTISASSLVGKVALYNSCSDVQPLYCAENELVVNSLTPGKTYYLQVWLEFSIVSKSALSSKKINESGTFNLNVQDTSVLSINELKKDDLGIDVYPNPVIDFITISSEENVQSFEVFSLSGQKIYYKENMKTKEIFDLRGFASGVYFLKINSTKGIYTQKIIKK